MLLEINDLSVEVSNKEILKDFNLNIKPGEIHAIMGPNGTGKSTLSNVIMGNKDYTVTKGDILFEEQSILSLSTDQRARLGIFMCMQNPISIEGVKNSEFLKTALSAKTGENIRIFDFIKLIDKNIKDLDMKEEMIHRSLNQGASGGERKKNEILQMKLLKPKFIILDELDSGLDIDSLKTVCDNINNYLQENKDASILIITHYPRILEYIKPNYVHIMLDGKIKTTKDLDFAFEIEKNGYNWLNEIKESAENE